MSRSGCSQVFVRRIIPSSRRLLGPAVAVADRSCFQDYPAVGVAADGTFIVTWASGTPKSPAAIVAERFSAQGRPLGRLFGISQSVPSTLLPVVSVDPNGHYFVVWESNDPNDAVHDIRGRWLEADGAPITPELTLNEAQDELDHLDQGTRHVEAAKVAINYFHNWYGEYPFPNLTIVDPRRAPVQPEESPDLMAEYASAACLIFDREEAEAIARELELALREHSIAA